MGRRSFLCRLAVVFPFIRQFLFNFTVAFPLIRRMRDTAEDLIDKAANRYTVISVLVCTVFIAAAVISRCFASAPRI